MKKKQILYIALQLNILHPLEPHQFNSMSPIGKSGRQTLRITNTYGMPFCDMPDNLDVGLLIFYLMDKIEATAINILVRELIQHIQRRLHAQLFTKNVGTFRADTLTVFYISNG